MAHDVAAAAAAGNECSQLPCALWTLVLRLLPPCERLLCAGLACKALHAAAAAATDSIQCEALSQAQCDALSSWLGHSGSAAPVTSLELEAAAGSGGSLLALPFAQLAGLRSLSVRGLRIEAAPAGPAAAGCASLAACTALTRLVCPGSMRARCRLGLDGLPELRGLRHLDLTGAAPQAGSDWASLLSTVGAALLLLTQLTHLALPVRATAGAVLQHVSALCQLQHLSTGCVEDPAASLGALPTGLTALCFTADDEASVLSPDSLPGWAQLTGLQRLQVRSACVQPALVAALVAACGRRLRHLQLRECQLEGAAADAAALTASSELTCLDLSRTQLPPGAAALLWPAGRLLPQLRVLRGSGALAESAEAVSGLARCCPALADLCLGYRRGSEDAEPEVPVPVLAPLRSLTGLTGLQLRSVKLSESWDDVCSLTRLRHLRLNDVRGVSWQNLALASRLTRLSWLSSRCGGEQGWKLDLRNKAPPDEPPDVCPAQLLEALLEDESTLSEEQFTLLEAAVEHMRSQRQQLAAARDEAAASQQQLAAARAEAAASQQQLAAARAEAAASQQQLAAAQQQLAASHAEAAALQARVTQLQQQAWAGRQ